MGGHLKLVPSPIYKVESFFSVVSHCGSIHLSEKITGNISPALYYRKTPWPQNTG
jgi:hypothetical protein